MSERDIIRAAAQFAMMDAGQRVLVALSGGADSVVLLHSLHARREQMGIALCAGHINHRLRESADADEDFVRRLCAQMQVPLHVHRQNVQQYAQRRGIGTEDAGRRVRYAALEQMRNTAGAHIIATAHTAADNAETVLLNLARGAGLRGLCGIPPINGRVVRPLILASRGDVMRYIDAHGLRYVVDETNGGLDFARNRVRNCIMPMLREQLNPRAAAVIAKNAIALREDADYLDDRARAASLQCVRAAADDCVVLDIAALLAEPAPIARRVVHQLLQQRTGAATHEHVQAVLDIAAGAGGRRCSVPGHIATNAYDTVVLQRVCAIDAPGGAGDFCHILHTPVQAGRGILHIPEIGRTIIISTDAPRPEGPAFAKKAHLLCTNVFCCGILDFGIWVRNFSKGDAIILQGRGAAYTKKLARWFADEKIPRVRRGEIPLLVSGGEIIGIMHPNVRGMGRVGAKFAPRDTQNNVWISSWGETN